MDLTNRFCFQIKYYFQKYIEYVPKNIAWDEVYILVDMMNVPRCRVSLILFNIHGDELLLETRYIRRIWTIYDV